MGSSFLTLERFSTRFMVPYCRAMKARILLRSITPKESRVRKNPLSLDFYKPKKPFAFTLPYIRRLYVCLDSQTIVPGDAETGARSRTSQISVDVTGSDLTASAIDVSSILHPSEL